MTLVSNDNEENDEEIIVKHDLNENVVEDINYSFQISYFYYFYLIELEFATFIIYYFMNFFTFIIL